jgi:hypothetical protein
VQNAAIEMEEQMQDEPKTIEAVTKPRKKKE